MNSPTGRCSWRVWRRRRRAAGWGGLPLGGVLGGVSGSAFGAAATLWLGAAGMTLSFLPAFLSPLRTLRTTRPVRLTAG
ncbi:hypothetical protein AB0C13_08585 [Streptomyces sp. NPDC049099]|uniref:hypothetical protein n=1 Tax=Streptomyces sp. NPDC049099 TaxID=3155768 RepID=UPI003447CF01